MTDDHKPQADKFRELQWAAFEEKVPGAATTPNPNSET